jgi:hypothetical protein
MHLLQALHCDCLQLLAQARDELPPETYCVGQHSRVSSSISSSSGGAGGGSSGGGSSSSRPISAASRDASAQQQQQQQQQQAWQLCLAQVQHNLLLLLQLSRRWQEQQPLIGFEDTFNLYMTR